MDEQELAGLAESIRSTGLIQPIAVRRVSEGAASGESGGGDGGGGAPVYEIVAGERRWRAAMLAGLERVPAVVVELSEREAAEWAIVENVQRSDLNAMERAHAFKRLAATFGMTHEEIAQRIGVDRTSVANYIRLTELDKRIQGMIASGRLSVGHAKALLGVLNLTSRLRLATQAQERGLSVRELESMCRRFARQRSPVSNEAMQNALREDAAGGATRDAARKDLEKQLSDHLGAKVKIRTDKTGMRGAIVVGFHDLDHFDGIMQRMGWRGE